MSKKNFKIGFDSLLGEEKKQIKDNVQEKVATFKVRRDYVDKVKIIACYEKKQIKDLINAALSNIIGEYEARNGIIKFPTKSN